MSTSPHHHHHAVGRDATKTASIHLTIAFYLSLCCESDVHESVFMSLSFRFLLMVSLTGDEGALSFCDQKTVESHHTRLIMCLISQRVLD